MFKKFIITSGLFSIFVVIFVLFSQQSVNAQNCSLQAQQAYKLSASPSVYYITADCTKRTFKNSKIFFTYFDSWSDVKLISRAKLDNISNDSLDFMPLGPKYDPKYGALVKTVKDPKVYLLLGTEKYWITDPTVFNNLNYSWNWIEDIDERLLNKYTLGSEINYSDRHPNYTLVKYKNNTKVYQLEPDPNNANKQIKKHIKNEAEFTSLGFRWDRIVEIDDDEVYESLDQVISSDQIEDVYTKFPYTLEPVLKFSGKEIFNNNSCRQNTFNTAFVLLGSESRPITQEDIDKTNDLKKSVSLYFPHATNNYAQMKTDFPVFILNATEDIFDGSNISLEKLTQKFYAGADDIYDFIVVVPLFDTDLSKKGISGYFMVRNEIKGIGLGIIDRSDEMGSKGVLRGVIQMQKKYHEQYTIGYPIVYADVVLHEIGHAWCCHLGDIFSSEFPKNKLAILGDDDHFYRGLGQSKLGGLMGGMRWDSNEDGTFSINQKETIYGKFHPIALYAMGLLPQSEYGKKHPIYDAGVYNPDNVNGYEFWNRPVYAYVSVDDIIYDEGERACQ